MMESTLAQLLSHIFDLELENARLKQQLGLNPTEVLPQPEAPTE